jgi:predicted Zn finger-like uncharacterized protein
MLIVCPTCGTTYNVGAATLGDSGRQVRCVRCNAVWVAGKSPPVATTTPKPKPGAMFDPELALAAARTHAASGSMADEPTFPPVKDAPPGTVAPDAESGTEPGDWLAGPTAPDTADSIVAPPLAPGATEEATWRTAPLAENNAGDDIESFAARRARLKARRKRSGWPLGRIQTALVALLIIDGALILWRSQVVRAFPQTAAFYAAIGLPVNLRGLTFENAKTTKETHEGVSVLVMEGGIVNATSKAIEVPKLRFAVRNAAGHEIYSWTAMPARTVLSAHEAVLFRSRLASPPPEANDVTVRFVGRGDSSTGGR